MIFLLIFMLPYLPMQPVINAPLPQKIEQKRINPGIERINNMYKAELLIRRSA